MPTSQIVLTKLSDIDANPLRNTIEYPFLDDKIEALRRSIRDTGFWEGVIGRKADGRTQIAFGHHRVEAAKRELGANKSVPIIVRELDDADMLKFMGRENLEEYNANFLIMLEAWEAASNFLSLPQGRGSLIEIAKFLGWTRQSRSRRDDLQTIVTHTAEACADATKLLHEGHLNKEHLRGLTVRMVRELCAELRREHERTEDIGQRQNRPREEIDRELRQAARATARVAERAQRGEVASGRVRGEVQWENRRQRAPQVRLPMFADFGVRLAEQLAYFANTDSASEKMTNVVDALDVFEMPEDFEVLRRIVRTCRGAEERLARFRKKCEDALQTRQQIEPLQITEEPPEQPPPRVRHPLPPA